MTDAAKKDAVYRMYTEYRKSDFPAVPDLTPQQAMDLLSRGEAVFVDTRKPEEMAVSMLPGAVSEQEFTSHPDRYRNKTVVAYCTISYRSGVFAREMAKRGFTVLNLQGGILAWTLEGGKVYDETGREVERVHVYGDEWNYAPSGYHTVTFGLWQRLF